MKPEGFTKPICSVKLMFLQTRADHFSGEVWIFFKWGLNIFQTRPERLSNSICSVKLGFFRGELNIFHMRVEHFSEEIWCFANPIYSVTHMFFRQGLNRQCLHALLYSQSSSTRPLAFVLVIDREALSDQNWNEFTTLTRKKGKFATLQIVQESWKTNFNL